MTKDQVKTLGEGDPQLQWWAMVLFAEVCEMVEHAESNQYEARVAWPYVVAKAKEFERLVVRRKLEDVKAEGDQIGQLAVRVGRLEDAVFGES